MSKRRRETKQSKSKPSTTTPSKKSVTSPERKAPRGKDWFSEARISLADKKKDQIMQGALRVFLQFGYEGTSMDRVASEAGVSKPTIYNHFLDKEGLFSSLVEYVVVDRFLVGEGQKDLKLAATDPHVYLTKLGMNFLRRMDDWEYLSFFRLVIAESARFPELAEVFIKKVIHPNSTNLAQYLEGQKLLGFSNPLVVARIFLGTLSSYMLIQEILYGKHVMPIAHEQFVKVLVDMTMSYAREKRRK